MILYFANLTTLLGWAPGVDSLNHGLLTNLLILNQKIQTTLKPIAPTQPWFEPFGFHILTANMSLSLNIYPGESMLLLSSIISLLTIMICFTTVYYITRSNSLSILSGLSGFFIFPIITSTHFLEQWFLGFYYNTPYPNLFGFFFLTLFIMVYFILNNKKERIFYAIMTIISLTGILLSYSPFIILPLSFFIFTKIFKIIKRGYIGKKIIEKIDKNHPNNKREKTIYIVNIIAVITIIFLILSISNYILDLYKSSSHDNNFLTLLNRIKNNTYYYTSAVLEPSSFTNISGYWILSILGLSIISIIKRNRKRLSYFYVFTASLLLISSFSQVLNNLLWFMLLGRIFAFMFLLSGIMMSIYIHDFLNWLANSKRLNIQNNLKEDLKNYASLLLSSLIIMFLFMPSLISNISLEQGSYWGWMVANADFKNDFKLFSWISNNINKKDLIMNDYTYTSKKIFSFSLANVTAIPIPILPAEVELAKDNALVWDKPTLLKSFIERYHVKYLLLDSDENHRVPPEIGGMDENIPRAYTPSDYKEILSHMPFLLKIKEYGLSTLYKVIN